MRSKDINIYERNKICKHYLRFLHTVDFVEIPELNSNCLSSPDEKQTPEKFIPGVWYISSLKVYLLFFETIAIS